MDKNTEEQPAQTQQYGAEENRAWMKTLVAAWVAQTTAMMGFSFALPFMRFYLEDLGVADKASQDIWTGVLIAAPALTMMFTAPLWGAVADRIGRKFMVMRAMFGGGLVLALMATATSPGWLVIYRLMQGALTGTITATTALVSGVTPRHRAGVSMGAIQTAIFFGSSVGPLLGGIAADQFGYRTTFIIAGALLAIGGVMIMLLASEKPPKVAEKTEEEPVSMLSLLKGPGFLTLLSVVIGVRFVNSFIRPVFPEFVRQMVESSGLLNTRVGAVSTVTAVTAAVASIPLGAFIDRVGPRRILAVGVIVNGVSIGLHVLAPSYAFLIVLRVVTGIGMGMVGPAMSSYVNRTVDKEHHGKAFGLVQSATSIGWSTGALVGGLSAAYLGLVAPFIITCLLQVATGGVVIYLLHEAPGISAKSDPVSC